MAVIRASAILTFALTIVYYVLRYQATRCTGLQCDNYIGPSLLLPILIVIGAGVSGFAAVAAAAAERQHGTWVNLLAVATPVSVAGPIVSAEVFRNSPGTLVPLATVLALLAPLGALLYSFLASPAMRKPPAS
jgi:hypothetical protein